MRSINLSDLIAGLVRLSILFLFVLVCVGARANSGEGEKAEGGEGGGEAKAENSDFAEYNKLINKQSQLRGKVQEGEKQLEELIIKKRMGVSTLKDEKGGDSSITDAITTYHKELRENEELYNANLEQLNYRFPSRGIEIKRQYHPRRPRSINQIENELGLDGQLSELKLKVQDKYKPFMPPAPVAKEPIPKSEQRSPASTAPERLKLVK